MTIKIGCVKWFNFKRGYGFITDIDNNIDVFVHHTGLKVNDNVFRILYTGEYVNYETIEKNGKDIAINVKGINGGKLLCEHRKK